MGVIIVLTDGAPSDRNAAAVAFKAAIAKGYQVQIVLIGFMAVFMPPDADWSSAPPMKMMGGYESLLQARAQVTDLVCSVSRKTEAPTALPTLPPSKYPTPSPTMEPTLDPTRTPTHTPTDEPTVSPTHVPTELPTRNPTPVPTEFPTEFPTLLPTKEPSPCRAARLHLIFRDESAPSAVTLAMSRRLLATARLETMKVELLKSTAVALKVTPSVLKITATSQADSTIHVEISFRGLDSLRMGADMETKILNGQFDPLPDYRIRKMWMEEVFDCDLLAAWNTPPYSGSDPEVFTSAPKVTSGAKPVPAPAVIAVSPVVEPEDVQPRDHFSDCCHSGHSSSSRSQEGVHFYTTFQALFQAATQVCCGLERVCVEDLEHQEVLAYPSLLCSWWRCQVRHLRWALIQ